MSELDEKLNAILSNQDLMEQIMALARSVSGEEERADLNENREAAPESAQGGTDLTQLLGVLDPGIIQEGMRLMGRASGPPDRTVQLLQAIRPFLRQERQERLDHAMRLAPMLRMMRLVMKSAQEKDGGGDV